MYEITFLETYPDGSLVMVHEAFADDDDVTIHAAINNEKKACQNGIILAFTTITFHERWNRPDLYRHPEILTIPSV